MKCPKCGYLGFETGDRCKNCGFNFSLLLGSVRAAEPRTDASPRQAPPEPPSGGGEDVVGDLSMRTSEAPLRASVSSDDGRARGFALPLFELADDELPPQLRAGPRPPLSVRRTPDASRVRVGARTRARPAAGEDEPLLRFGEELVLEPPATAADAPPEPTRSCAAGSKRLAAAAIDLGLLCAIAAIVVYLTLRMVELPLVSWRLLPAAPMAIFLGLVTFAYLGTFTAVGGQTVGKMAVGVRVVNASGEPLGAAAGVRRAATASLVSLVTLGLGFLPAVIGSTRLAVHDRLAGTRVVDDS